MNNAVSFHKNNAHRYVDKLQICLLMFAGVGIKFVNRPRKYGTFFMDLTGFCSSSVQCTVPWKLKSYALKMKVKKIIDWLVNFDI